MQEEGRLWQACGVLAAAGALRSTVLLLRRCGVPDCAAAFVRACGEAGFGADPRAPVDSGTNCHSASLALSHFTHSTVIVSSSRVESRA